MNLTNQLQGMLAVYLTATELTTRGLNVAVTSRVVCVKFSKLVMVRGRLFLLAQAQHSFVRSKMTIVSSRPADGRAPRAAAVARMVPPQSLTERARC